MYPDLAKCRENCQVAEHKSVFYSVAGYHQLKPQQFADMLPNGVFLRESFPVGFTDENSNATGYAAFMKRLSQAFAETTSSIAYVLSPTDGFTDLSKKTWSKIEKPALMAINGTCCQIVTVDPDEFDSRCIVWDRQGGAEATMANVVADNSPVPLVYN